jgi:hypothetical protein
MIKSTVCTLVAILAVSTAFSPVQQRVAFARATTRVLTTPLSMVMVDNSNSNDRGIKPLESVEAIESVTTTTTTTSTETPKQGKRQFTNLSTGEISDLNVDIQQDMSVSPFHLEWWAYLFVAYPFILLADDVFHFLPNGSLWDVFSMKM